MTKKKTNKNQKYPPGTGRQGWEQFLANKHDMLYKYEVAKKYSRSHVVQTYHGNVAEAVFREWLTEFLPERFGVSSGRIISQGLSDTDKAPHYDVIIYDRLLSPTLWIEKNPDNSTQGRTRAFPAEYVYAVIEVKAVLDKSSAKEALEKLEELRPLLLEDAPNERYKKYLPPTFSCATIFFEVKEDSADADVLNNLLPKTFLRGYFGGMVLSSEGRDADITGKLWLMPTGVAHGSNIAKGNQSITKNNTGSATIAYNGQHVAIFLTWLLANFADFAFTLVARLNGTYEDGFVPSWHGFAWI